jgi:hypothetical protein
MAGEPLRQIPANQDIEILRKQLLREAHQLLVRGLIGVLDHDPDQIDTELLSALADGLQHLHPERVVGPDLRTYSQRVRHTHLQIGADAAGAIGS